ncbi:hypothetical protein BD413DRAFT_599140 [Trametes elegans]|nr:hypothetical protein BD413DRAFT_599140 [Trametes elegans]
MERSKEDFPDLIKGRACYRFARVIAERRLEGIQNFNASFQPMLRILRRDEHFVSLRIEIRRDNVVLIQ